MITLEEILREFLNEAGSSSSSKSSEFSIKETKEETDGKDSKSLEEADGKSSSSKSSKETKEETEKKDSESSKSSEEKEKTEEKSKSSKSKEDKDEKEKSEESKESEEREKESSPSEETEDASTKEEEEDLGETPELDFNELSEEIKKLSLDNYNTELLDEIKLFTKTVKRLNQQANNAFTNYSARGKKFIPSRYGSRPDRCMQRPGTLLEGKGKVDNLAILLISDESGSLGCGDTEVNKVITTLDMAEKLLYPKFTYEICRLGNRLTYASKGMSPKNKKIEKLFVHSGGGNSVPEDTFSIINQIKRNLKNYNTYTVFMFDGYINTNEARKSCPVEDIIKGFKSIIDNKTYIISNTDISNEEMFKEILGNIDRYDRTYLSTKSFVEEMGNKVINLMKKCRQEMSVN